MPSRPSACWRRRRLPMSGVGGGGARAHLHAGELNRPEPIAERRLVPLPRRPGSADDGARLGGGGAGVFEHAERSGSVPEPPMTTSLPPAGSAVSVAAEEAEHLVGDGALDRVLTASLPTKVQAAPVTPIVPAAVLSAGAASVARARSCGDPSPSLAPWRRPGR